MLYKICVIVVLLMSITLVTRAHNQLFVGQPCNLVDGTRGVCKNIEHCESQKEKFRIGIMETKRCSFDGLVEYICCSDERPPPETPELPNLRERLGSNKGEITFPNNQVNIQHQMMSKPIRPLIESNIQPTTRLPPSLVQKNEAPAPSIPYERSSVAACREYSQPRVNSRLLDGLTVYNGELPHMASLGYFDVVKNETIFVCGGTIIAEDFILTAAHCFVDGFLPKFARLGRVVFQTSIYFAEREPIDVEIKKIIKHPNYSKYTKKNDIALVQLVQSIEISPIIHPACLHTDFSDLPTDVTLVVAGWGSVKRGTTQTVDILTRRNLRTMQLSRCNSTLLDYADMSTLPTRRLAWILDGLCGGQYCARDPTTISSHICNGDKGDQLMIYNSTISTVVGVVSFEPKCEPSFPTVYTRVAFYLDWIESIVWPSAPLTWHKI